MHVVNTEQLKVNKSLSSEAIQEIAKALAMAAVGGRTLLTRSEKAALLRSGVCRATS